MHDRQRHRVHEIVQAEVGRQWTLVHGIQKSMQRPLRSQSPKRVGSGPVGPPCSVSASGATRGAVTPGEAATSASGTVGESTSEGAFGTAANSARIAPLR